MKRLWSLAIARPTLAALIPFVTFGLQWLIWPVLHPFAWIPFAFTVVISSWIGGAASGVWATFLSTALVWWAFLPPEQDWRVEHPRYFVSTAIFIALGLAMSAFQGRLKRATRETARALDLAREANEQLERIAEERLLFEGLVDAARDFIGVTDPSGNFRYLNPAGRRLVELPDDCNVEDTRCIDYFPAHLRAFELEVIDKAVREHGAWDGETYLRGWRSEDLIPVSHAIFVIREPASGRPLGRGTIIRDMRERKRWERDQQFLADVGYTLARTLDYDQTLTNVAQLAVSELADFCLVDVVQSDGRVLRLRAVSRDPSKGDLCDLLMRSTAAPELPLCGEVEAHSVLSVPLFAHGQRIGTMTFLSCTPGRVFDPHDMRVAEELAVRAGLAIDNARLYREARRAVQVRDDVLGIVAHDLRNPLNAILVQSQMLGRRGGEPERRSQRPVDAIRRNAKRMNRLIEDLLDVTRLEADGLSIEPARISAGAVVCEAVENQLPTASSSSIDLRVEVARDLPDVWADRERLLQVLENLIGNSIKFTESGGRITVGVDCVDGENLFWVMDTGRGIAAEDMPHIFDRFWQSKRGGRRGTGLGLPIVKGLVEAHGGRVWVESAPGCGSTFRFTIPTTPRSGQRMMAPPERLTAP
jgi:signal transduction histidine kinase/PAS domain-containing protein